MSKTTFIADTIITKEFLNAVNNHTHSTGADDGCGALDSTATTAAVAAASETVAGKIALATDAKAQAWTDDLTAITPYELNMALKGSNQSLAASGYQKLPGGLIVQWGSDTNTTHGHTVSFPISFTTCYSVAVSGNATGTYFHQYLQSFTSSEYVQGFRDPSGNAGNASIWSGYFIAIGV